MPQQIGSRLRVGRLELGLRETPRPLLPVAADSAATLGWNGRYVGGRSNSKGLTGEVGKYLAGGLASGAPFLDG